MRPARGPEQAEDPAASRGTRVHDRTSAASPPVLGPSLGKRDFSEVTPARTRGALLRAVPGAPKPRAWQQRTLDLGREGGRKVISSLYKSGL